MAVRKFYLVFLKRIIPFSAGKQQEESLIQELFRKQEPVMGWASLEPMIPLPAQAKLSEQRS